MIEWRVEMGCCSGIRGPAVRKADDGDLTSCPPGRVDRSSLRTRSDSEDGGYTVGVAVDGASHGSPLVLGLGWIRPGTERVSWEVDDETHEVYYVSAGALRVRWSGPSSGESIVGAHDCFYFAPGHSYSIENAGEQEVSFVWTVTPGDPGAA